VTPGRALRSSALCFVSVPRPDSAVRVRSLRATGIRPVSPTSHPERTPEHQLPSGSSGRSVAGRDFITAIRFPQRSGAGRPAKRGPEASPEFQVAQSLISCLVVLGPEVRNFAIEPTAPRNLQRAAGHELGPASMMVPALPTGNWSLRIAKSGIQDEFVDS